MFSPSLEEFKRLAEAGEHIPVFRTLLADTVTPVSAFQALSAGSEFAFLFESVEGGEIVGRYSFLGSGPFLVLKSDLKTVEVTRGSVKANRTPEGERTPLDEVEEVLARYRPVEVPGLPRFCGGAVGYFSYDVVRLLEPLGEGGPEALGAPDMYLMFYDTLVIFDHVRKVVQVVCYADTTGVWPEEAYARAQQRIDGLVERLKGAPAALADDIHPGLEVTRPFESNFSKEGFEKAVERIKEYIRAGDVIQAVLSQRLRARTRAHPFDIYRVLRAVNPSPYMFYLQFPDLQLVGSSPEVMVRVEGRTITVRPIAGTRPRGGTPEEDAELEAELKADPKERAEHAMLLDLGRNDVGRVSEYGSVGVREKMIVERYSHVMHLVSHVEGRLREGLSSFDALKACLPAGTVSGAPKVRAMQVIDELEADRRGPYAGAVGYLDFHGNLDTCIAIRTIVIPSPIDAPERDAYVQAGAGIVADSVPASEFAESLNKAKALIRAIELAEASFGRAGAATPRNEGER